MRLDQVDHQRSHPDGQRGARHGFHDCATPAARGFARILVKAVAYDFVQLAPDLAFGIVEGVADRPVLRVRDTRPVCARGAYSPSEASERRNALELESRAVPRISARRIEASVKNALMRLSSGP